MEDNNTEQEVVDTQVQEEVPEVTTDEVAEAAPEEKVTEEDKTDKEDPKQSWKELRKKADRAEKLEKERDEYYSVLKQIEQQALQYQEEQKKKAAPKHEEIDINSIGDEDYVEGKQLKQFLLQEKRHRAAMEENIKIQQSSARDISVENQLKNKYQDWNDVFNKDNIKRLRDADPDLAESIYYNPDIRKKSIATYNAIKKYGIYKEDTYKDDKAIAKYNASKPKASNSVAGTGSSNPLAQAGAYTGTLTRDMKDRIYREAKAKAQGWD